MIKIFKIIGTAFAAIALLSSCDSKSSTSLAIPIYYSYGNRPLPGTLAELPIDYRPQSLNSKTFISDNKSFSPVDIQQEDLQFAFNVETQTATGHALLSIKQSESGFTYFQMNPTVKSISVDGNAVNPLYVHDPDGLGKIFVSPNQLLDIGLHTLIIDYDLPASAFSFQNGGIGLLTDMSDLPKAHFFETFAPVGFEDDAFELHLHLQILNSVSIAPHHLFTNGTATVISTDEWQIDFPKYFTTSSIYFHLTNKLLIQDSLSYQGLNKIIPITIYSVDADLIQQAKALLPTLFKELETTYGVYPHDQFVAYIHSGSGGMEYSGATITSISALGHELFHSWFGRGWQPAEGRSGWIDEAFASWRDYNYFQAETLLNRPPTTLAGFSPFESSTPTNCYRDGRRLIAELDRALSGFGGMKLFMKLFVARYQHHVVTVEEFQGFLSTLSQMDLSIYFKRYVFGENEGVLATQYPSPDPMNRQDTLNASKHPDRLSTAEVQLLR